MPHSLVPASLRYADQVARSGSIQKAARELHVAASAINRQILQLEDELGVPLFERLPRGMRPTASGEAVITMLRRWGQDERRLVAEVRRIQGVRQGHVSLVAMDSHSTSVLPRLVAQLSAQHPLISLSIDLATPDDAEVALMGGKADLGAIFNLAPRRDLMVLWKSELPLGCVVAPGHPLAQSASVSFQEATVHPVALQSRALTIRRYLEAQYSWLFQAPRRFVESNSLQLVKQLAMAGQHVVFTSELDAAAELIDGRLVFVPIRDRGAEPQGISVAVDAARPPGSVVKLVAEQLVVALQEVLAAARAAKG
ncbi:MAG: LysR family transcriptional regulator [Hydrogenophaga sp.]|jgi:DNA-binding transcriptional LysR family regulator|uniref:LysR family transcriptional regulator n=1 Tax=Hydrogenophaga sp. TaxID=1904254 RepID=UPI001D9EB03B|nr:LysR family transcriptional regulator [Hydrogenophaga sp.]MBW0168977.1 LysR family transcriptional regulator [Hydrogenophaga sp.]MBW0185666.1 LysR family transcriptional regulator [Hydrogenophaga sp.]